VAERLREIEDEVGTGGEYSEERPDLLSFLLKNTSWGPSKVVDNAVDLLGAGIDTVCMPYWGVHSLSGLPYTDAHSCTHSFSACSKQSLLMAHTLPFSVSSVFLLFHLT